MRLRRVLPLLSIAMLALAVAAYASSAAGRPQPLEDYGPAPEFSLTNQDDRTLSSQDLKGQVVVADFIFTNCTDLCPLLSARMKETQDALRQAGLLDRNVKLLSFSVDSARDTPAVLQAYAERYRADTRTWQFLTGPEEVMGPLVERGFYLGLIPLPPPASAEPGTAPLDFVHAGRFVLVDRAWRLRAYRDAQNLDVGRLVDDVRTLLR